MEGRFGPRLETRQQDTHSPKEPAHTEHLLDRLEEDSRTTRLPAKTDFMKVEINRDGMGWRPPLQQESASPAASSSANPSVR